MKHTSEFTSVLAIGKTVTGISRGPAGSGTYETEWSGVYAGIQPSEWTGAPVHCFYNGIVGVTPQSRFAIPVSHFALKIDEIDHSQCDPTAHDRSLPDDGGRLHADLYDEHGFLSDKQVMTPDGLLGCNDCGQPMFYCTNAEWYFHTDPDAGCFLSGPWRRE